MAARVREGSASAASFLYGLSNEPRTHGERSKGHELRGLGETSLGIADDGAACERLAMSFLRGAKRAIMRAHLRDRSSWRLGSPWDPARARTRPGGGKEKGGARRESVTERRASASEYLNTPLHPVNVERSSEVSWSDALDGGDEDGRRTSASERKPPLPEMALKWQKTAQ